jgi:hypothetical protein
MSTGMSNLISHMCAACSPLPPQGCEDILLALHQAQAACTSMTASTGSEGSWGGLEVPRDTHMGEREVGGDQRGHAVWLMPHK